VNWKRTGRILAFLAVAVVVAGCAGGPRSISTLADMPVHPQAQKIDALSYRGPLPAPHWNVFDGKVADGPYAGYRTLGFNLYTLPKGAPNPSVEDYYTSQMSGWTKGTADSGTDDYTGAGFWLMGWTKDNMAVVVMTSSGSDNMLFLELLQRS
jgi:hypothetical protein